jgi:hypothetical protein
VYTVFTFSLEQVLRLLGKNSSCYTLKMKLLPLAVVPGKGKDFLNRANLTYHIFYLNWIADFRMKIG